MSTSVKGPLRWSMTVDSEGHRDYKITHRVVATDADDGPRVVFDTTGLPAVGDAWSFDNDSDTNAICHPDMTIRPVVTNEPNFHWDVENLFSTRPFEDCTSPTDPLLEPQKVSGSFVKYTREATEDISNPPKLLKSSSHEMFRGPAVEVDANRPTVTIGQNVASLGLSTFAQMVDTVNDGFMWGLPARTVKLSNVSWERKIKSTCTFYYTRTFEFDIRYETWDRRIVDEGTKVLNGYFDQDGTWQKRSIGNPLMAPDPDNPRHFIRYKDMNEENTRVLLNGAGEPLTDQANPFVHVFMVYEESNFFTLGIPTSL